ncbi:ribonucleases P/MRP protein subunit POP1 isoform X1 [Triplophysa dalaica]|uniref:ribonucleases P/MRP protein subunit POP1 isoform X1 n=1 Tax=Triplophysa dalaica TaxID=1582913 RepID=UPI0024E00F3C|nr:ribonucleases P/MRP protein subunit POP1 isoform X1 [Triplophysa dalaica]
MTGAKDRMRQKKMKNQPRNVTYSSTGDVHIVFAFLHCCWMFSDVHKVFSTVGVGRSVERGQVSHASGWVRGHQAGGLGYTRHLPKYITASHFANARAAEVNSMLKAVSKPAGSCHVFNELPKHMRRRAMSHNTKRLPSRLREGANKLMERCQQTEKEKKHLPKRRSRRARRRHGNLLLEFNRRQRKNKWLETHIWHAKRFHMLKRWSYCLPHRPTAKTFRSSYRAMNTHALLQDLSYFCCLELQGSEETILRALVRLTSKDTGPTFGAELFLSGSRQGSVHLYRADQFPHGSLGPADFLWRPRAPHTSHRQLWIWIHPALKAEVVSELQLVCQCLEVLSTSEEISSVERTLVGQKRKRDDEDCINTPSKKLFGDCTRAAGTPVRWGSADTAITISDLTMEIVRYRLIGPLAHLVLTDTLLPANEDKETVEPSGFWWPNHSQDQTNMKLHQQQTDTFQLLRGVCSTGEIPAGCVLGLTVDDPRLSLPQRRSKTLPDLQPSAEECGVRDLTLRGVVAHCGESALWDASVRHSVTHNQMAQQELNRMRSEALVPGSRLAAPPQSRVPVLLVHQPGRVRGEERRHWGSGWDLLLPKGWGMAFWIPLVYRGVRVGGLHMSVKHSQFKGQPHFPHDYPDCPAGTLFQSEQEAELIEKFKRRPPSKRTNYIKHGCLAPFCCPWQQLTEEWEELMKLNEGTSSICRTRPAEFTVLRNLRVLRQLSVWCRPSRSRRATHPPLTPEVAAALQGEWGRSLIWVRLRLLSKGQPALHAMVCVPTVSDLLLLLKAGRSSGPLEPLHKDHVKNMLKRKHKASHASEGSSSAPHSNASEALPVGLIRGVWPQPLPSVLSHCSRLTLGWVQKGDFSLAAGCGEALAYVSVSGLLHTLLQQPQEQRGIVLLRNPSSLQYRYAQIVVDI